MKFLEIQTDFAGQIGFRPRRPKIRTDATLSEVLTAGFLNSPQAQGKSFYPDDMIDISYDDNISQTFTIASISSAGVITLQVNNADVVLPVTANHIAVFTDANGTLGDDAATAINGGTIQAGLDSVQGHFTSYPPTTAKGKLIVGATDNIGNFDTTITHNALGQATTYLFPDPGTILSNPVVRPSTAAWVTNDLVVGAASNGIAKTAGARIISGTTAAYGGGGTSNAFTVTGLTSAAVGAAVIRTSTNAVAIAKALPGTNTLTITFSADPGAATTVDYIYTTAALT